MFKNLTLYSFDRTWNLTTAQVEAAIAQARFLACGATAEQSAGWSEPRGIAHAVLAESVGDWLIARYTTETKVLPANVVRRAADERAAKLEAQLGRPIGRAERRDLREETRLDLLPRAFTRVAHTHIGIDRRRGLLLIDSCAAARTEAIAALLMRCLDNLTLTRLTTATSAATQMAAWLLAHDAPGRFAIDEECELRATDDTGSVVRYSKHSLNNAEVRKHIGAGKLPTRLALTWNGRVSFVLTEQAQLRRVRLLDGVLKGSAEEDEEDAADRFDADWTITTGEIGALATELIEALGGMLAPEA